MVNYHLQMGGSERLVLELAKGIDKDRFEPSIAWFEGEIPSPGFRELGIPLYYVPKKKRFDYPAIRKMANILINNRIDVVNAHHFMPFIYSSLAALRKKDTRVIYTAHSIWEIEQLPWYWKFIGSRLFNNTTLAVGVDESISNSLRKTFHLTEKNCFTIRNGVDIHSFETSMADRNQVRHELGINREDFVLGMVANFRAVKNHLFLLEAFYRLASKDERWKLVLVGQGFERDTDNTEPELRKYVADKGLEKNVLFLGFRPDVGKLLGGMDIFCMTSIKEGLPISILEAMASGLPIIGTDVEGINSVVEPNRNGFLAGLNKVDEFRKYIELLLVDEELRRRFGEASRKIAFEKYSFDKCIAGYQELFLAGENNGHAASSLMTYGTGALSIDRSSGRENPNRQR